MEAVDESATVLGVFNAPRGKPRTFFRALLPSSKGRDQTLCGSGVGPREKGEEHASDLCPPGLHDAHARDALRRPRAARRGAELGRGAVPIRGGERRLPGRRRVVRDSRRRLRPRPAPYPSEVTRRRRTAVAVALATVTVARRGAAAGGTASGGPVATAGPTVIGTAAAGKQLTGLSGTWGGFEQIDVPLPVVSLQRRRRGPASRSTARPRRRYPLGDRDVGKTLGLTVTPRTRRGPPSAYSSLVGPIAPRRPLLESTAQPVVDRAAGPGEDRAGDDRHLEPRPRRTSRTAGSAATRTGAPARRSRTRPASSYTVASADLGHALLAIVQATNGATIQNAFSTATPAVVAALGPRPARQRSGPYVTGTAIVGAAARRAATGIWKGVGPIVFAYRWYRCDAQRRRTARSIHSATANRRTRSARRTPARRSA